ncbi:hypothetical protein SH2C18_16550 [Clostridium sediminicola]|uniref:ATP cone domain-containing protein n=1 Tax=Clostridium sediminicola TaxID=3114879 RepID=UPI0031F1EAB7
MKVIKRDGRMQDFDKNKIKVSIMRASDDAKEPFNTSDIENVTGSVTKALGDRVEIKVIEIHEIILKTLKDFGFNKTAELFDKVSNLT